MTTPPNPGALLNFELGRLWETPIENALRQAGLTFVSQIFLKDEDLGVAGTLDIALLHPDNEWELVSIKTEGVNKQFYRKRENKTFFESNPEYAVQEAVYRHLMIKNGFTVKDTAKYIVITKDNGFIDEPVLAFTDKLIRHTKNRMELLRAYIDEDKLPDCECEGWKVGYCNYGNPETQENNKKGKLINTECCGEELWLAVKQAA